MWLLVGADSEIGAATFASLTARGIACAGTTRRRDRVAPDRPYLDLAQPLEDWQPPAGTTAVCILAAVARIAACDADSDGSSFINVTQTAVLAERLLAQRTAVLLLSTNQVFDGHVPQVPADAPTCPTTEYGRQKARIEAVFRAHMDNGAPASILRLSKVVSRDMPLIRGWIEALRTGRRIKAFTDMTMAPVEMETVAAAVEALLRDRARGVFQLTGDSDISYFELALTICRQLGTDTALVERSNTKEAGLPPGTARLHTTLDSRRLRDQYGLAANTISRIVATWIAAAQADGSGVSGTRIRASRA